MADTDLSTPQASSSEVHDIAPTGDVILVVEDSKSAATRLRVSSYVLSQASPVLRNLFSSKYSEGSKRSCAERDSATGR